MVHSMAYVVLAGVAFALHVVWERLHIVLYTGYGALEGVLPVYIFATVGDVAYTLVAVLLLSFLTRKRMNEFRYSEYGLLAALGLSIAIFVEVKAHLLGRWEYTDAMPTLIGLGISPLIQMTMLLPLSVFISVLVTRRFARYH